MRNAVIWAIVLCLFLPVREAGAAVVELTMASFEDGRQAFYAQVVTEALAARGQETRITFVAPMPQLRVEKFLESGHLTLHPFFHAKHRDEAFIPVPGGIMDGLLGHRVLLIPAGQAGRYAGVGGLDAFRDLKAVGAFGRNWYDVDVWRANNLPFVVEDGDWRIIYEKLARGVGGYDYFSRGVTEVKGEMALRPELALEPRLLFLYERAYQFYLSPARPELAEVLRGAMAEAVASGLVRRLVRERYAKDLQAIGYDRRLRILLEAP